jgi:hypothetical protein
MSLADTVLRYLQDQTEENFLALRSEIAAVPDFSPYANYESIALPLIQQERFQDAIDALKAAMPGGFLNPGLHDLLARIHAAMGNEEEARNETYLALAAMNGILFSGDGSEAKPYLVLQVADEYDVLRALGKESRQQTVGLAQGNVRDRHVCADESVLWFDLTPSVQRTQAV